jgi:hypothetical protein
MNTTQVLTFVMCLFISASVYGIIRDKQAHPCAQKCHALEACVAHRKCIKEHHGRCPQTPNVGNCPTCLERSRVCRKCWKECNAQLERSKITPKIIQGKQ